MTWHTDRAMRAGITPGIVALEVGVRVGSEVHVADGHCAERKPMASEFTR